MHVENECIKGVKKGRGRRANDKESTSSGRMKSILVPLKEPPEDFIRSTAAY